MSVWLNREGLLTSQPTGAGALLPDQDPNVPINVTKLGNLVYLVRYDDELEVHLVVFRSDISLVPRIVLLHNVPIRPDTSKMAEICFSRLLGFDNNRLGNRDRNIILPILRPFCREFFKGSFDNEMKTLNYAIHKDMLSVFDSKDKRLIHLNYIKLSRSIKDKL